MVKEPTAIVSGDIVTDKLELTLEDLCDRCELSATEITAYVEEGIIEAEGAAPAKWRFSRMNVIEVKRAQRLTNDLGLNPAGAALALELLKEIEGLKRRLARFGIERTNDNAED